MGRGPFRIKGQRMRIRKLGQIGGAVLAFGGPYSNAHALRALLAIADHRGVPPGRMICTGDIVAYGADPLACLGLMQTRAIPCIAGNCEKQLASGAADCGCGFDAGTTCDRLSAGWFAHADKACGPALREWMGQLPDIAVFTHAGRRVAVIHGGVTDIARFVWPTSPEAVFAEEIEALRAVVGAVDLVIAGHSGVPFLRRIGAVTWLNPGAIGMPPHDGRADTSYAVLEADGTPDIRRLSYDHTAAALAMEAAGLTQGYHQALRDGWWPSEDVLPEALRRQG